MGHGGPVLIPETRRMATQVFNVEDLADRLIHCGENMITGVLNSSGELIAFEDLIAACRPVTKAVVSTVRVPGAWLVSQGIEEFPGKRSPTTVIHDPSGA